MTTINDVNRVLATQMKYEKDLLKRANVQSVGVGYIMKGGKYTEEIGITVNVSKKSEINALGIPDRLPTELDGIRVDVIEKGFFVDESLQHGTENLLGYNAQGHDFKSEVGKMTPGYSQGNKTITAGTTGYPARRTGTEECIILTTSNAHVQCSDPSLTMSEQASLEIYQPGKHDGGNNVRADLTCFEQIYSDKRNKCDSAASTLRDQTDYTTVIPIIGAITYVDESDPVLGEIIEKVGRTTGYTKARAVQINVVVKVGYATLKAPFERCIITENMSAGGDSGSMGIVTRDIDKAKGYKYRLFAGSPNATIYFHIREEMSDLRIYPILSGEEPDSESGIEVNFELEADDGSGTRTYTVFGVVGSTAGNPVKDALVSIGMYQDMTTVLGKYKIEKVPEGVYQASASKENYETDSKEVVIGDAEKTVESEVEADTYSKPFMGWLLDWDN